MDLSIIIVNWNTKRLLDECLSSIYRETQKINFEIFVVDNLSSDGSAQMVREKYLPARAFGSGRWQAGPQVKLIENKENRGFAAANNQALKGASGRYILFLNPDTIIIENALDKGVE